MKYSHETLHKLLLRMQSLDYPGYKDATELDMLAHLLTREQIKVTPCPVHIIT